MLNCSAVGSSVAGVSPASSVDRIAGSFFLKEIRWRKNVDSRFLYRGRMLATCFKEPRRLLGVSATNAGRPTWIFSTVAEVSDGVLSAWAIFSAIDSFCSAKSEFVIGVSIFGIAGVAKSNLNGAFEVIAWLSSVGAAKSNFR